MIRVNKCRKKKYIALVVLLMAVSLLTWFTSSEDSIVMAKEAGEYKEIIVIFEDTLEEAELQNLVAMLGSDLEIKRHIDNYALLSVKELSKFNDVLTKIQNYPNVLAAEENVEITSLGTTNDPYSDAQWAFDNPGYYTYISRSGVETKTAVSDVDLDLKEAWEQIGSKKKREVVIAIIDTGIDYNHPDLSGRMWTNSGEIPGDNLDNDNNGYIDDYYGWDFYNNDSSTVHYNEINQASPDDNDDHGTHIAGIIAAEANNNVGIAGIASNIDVKIMTLKINGGTDGTGDLSDAIEAIKYATMMGADICNISWGTNTYINSIEQIMKESDMLFVAAAGNSGTNNDSTPVYPASFDLPNLISVTFINSKGELHKLSNYGMSSVDVAAPGEDIFSTTVGSYSNMSGSSMAAPHVTAVAAILYASDDNLYPSNVKKLILDNTKPLQSLKGYISTGGIPSVYLAIQKTDGLERDTELPELEMETIYDKNEFLIPVTAKDSGSGIRVIKWIIGNRTLEEFRRGVAGTSVNENRVTLTKAGIYTFYASDYAGNEIIKTYEVVDDKTAPKISASYTVAKNQKYKTISVKVSDNQSGIKRVKHISGEMTAKELLEVGVGKEIALENGKADIIVGKDGIYTIFASDNRGNLRVKQIEVKTVKAKEIQLVSNKKSMKVGDVYKLRTYVDPTYSTDTITYTSSNKKVVKVTSSGEITALKKGKAKITVKATSGVKAVCQITVK